MKNYVIAFALACATSMSAEAASWKKLIDCKDVHGNQLVIDLDTDDNYDLQMVLRPSSSNHPSVIQYLRDHSMVYGQARYDEVVVKMERGNIVDFQYSDTYMTHIVKLDNPMPSRMSRETGALLLVQKNGNEVNWYFNTCTKYY